jgi:transcriptional regulator with XRE-family HTH domain
MPGSDPLGAIRLAVVLSEQERRERTAYAIRTARERRGMTPPQLAELLGRQRGTVNDWEANKTMPSLVDLGPLCAALGVEPRLFAELPPIPPDPVAEYLIGEAVQAATTEGLSRARRRRARATPETLPRPRVLPADADERAPE